MPNDSKVFAAPSITDQSEVEPMMIAIFAVMFVAVFAAVSDIEVASPQCLL
jgi:hypothetical protein